MHCLELFCLRLKKLTLFHFCSILAFICAICLTSSVALAQSVSNSDLVIADHALPGGGGGIPTALQYLNTQGYDIKSAAHMASAMAMGDMTASYPLDLPPAILKPSLVLSYSSDAGINLEMPYGWSLEGIVEIRRPLTRGYEIDGEKYDREYLLSGLGLSGVLKPSGHADWRFFLKTSDPKYVTAEYDNSSNVWTVYHDTLTLTLEEQDNGTGSVDGTAVWRVTEMRDRSGNQVSYTYTSHGLLSKISYGGNPAVSQKHLVDIDFEYADNVAERTNARAGFVVHYRKHLTRITISSRETDSETTKTSDKDSDDSGVFFEVWERTANSNRLYAYELVCTEKDSLDLMTALEREGKTSAQVETIATFEYSEFDNSTKPQRSSENGPENLGTTYHASNKYWELYNVPPGRTAITEFPDGSLYSTGDNGIITSYREAYSGTTKTLLDFNRDGLPDAVDASEALLAAQEDGSDLTIDEPWTVTPKKVNHSDRSFSRGTLMAVETPERYQFEWSKVEPPQNLEDYFENPSVVHTTHQIADVDGDGYPDQIISGNEANLRWSLYFGNGEGFDAVISVNGPLGWAYSQTSSSVKADTSSSLEADNVQKMLMDLNGDGWLDAYDPAAGTVAYHSGTRTGGWLASESLPSPASAISTVLYTFKDVATQYPTEHRGECERGTFLRVECPLGAQDAAAYTTFCDDMCVSACAHDMYQCQLDCDGDATCMGACRVSSSTCSVNCQSNYCQDDQRYIANTDEVGAFYDLNGDGLSDYVDAGATPWEVSLNNGNGFEDPVTWSSPSSYLRRSDEGFSVFEDTGDDDDDSYSSPTYPSISSQLFEGEDARVYQMLIDVDGDGLLDLAMGQDLGSQWYKNKGTGFESSARPLPAWWPDDFIVSSSTVYVDNDPYPDSDDWFAESKGETLSLMIDIDHDGAMDLVNESGISYGPYPRPYILTKIENAQGGATEVSYRSLATVSPSGDQSQTQHTPNVKSLVDVITSSDAITRQNAETNFTYTDGYFEDDLFQGFGSRRVTNKINGSWTGSTQYEYELDHDLSPLIKTQELYGDSNLNFAPSLARGAQAKSLLFAVTNDYDDYGDYFHLLKTRKVTEYGESSGSKSTTHSYTWDDYGNLKLYAHDGGGVSDDAITVNFSYVADNANADDARFYRMAMKQVSGTDPLDGSYRVIEHTRYYYDDHADYLDTLTDGQLTKTQVLAGWHDGGKSLDDDKLEVTYTHGRRGEILSATDVTTGTRVDQTFGFGGAVLETQTNSLGQKNTRTIDGQGRIDSIANDNGLVISLTYDAFNRMTDKSVTDTDGQSHLISDSQYFRTSAPYYTMNRAFDETGAVDQTSYTLENGFGHMAESWHQSDDGHYLATKSISDLRGLVTMTSHPKDMGTSFSLPTSGITILNPFTKFYYDASGTPRETIRDSAVPTGSQLVYQNKPWSKLIQDEAGYQTRLNYDAHHRITTVEQGQSNVFTTTATYRYDPLNRLVSFKDGKGTIITYSYDGAGRLRQVKSGGVGSSGMANWYKYGYKGLLKTSMIDNTGAFARWEYDILGRPTTLKIKDSLPSSTGLLTYAYEYDTAWKGAIFKTTDPAGSTTYAYDKLGREERAKRTYVASAVGTQSPEFLYDYDLQGQLKTKTLPSGHRLTSNYDYGYLTSQTALTAGVTDYTLDFDYNKWGLQTQVASSLGHSFTNTFTTPLWADTFKMQFGSSVYVSTYTWANNGLLSKRAENIGTGSAIYNYTYDELKQVTKMATPTKTIESYTYDAVGNPLTMQDKAGLIWTYAHPTTRNQIPSRTSNTGKINTYTYDAAGRIKAWKSSTGTYVYYYDGLGRLRGSTKNGVWQMVLDYDADGSLVRRGDNNPNTSSPYYTYSFRDWRYKESTSTLIEDDSSIVSAENGKRKWFFKSYDGHPTIMFDDAGVVQSKRSLGVYGNVISSVGTSWDWNSFHGAEDQGELFHMGQRHLMQNDGMWLQPEPLLYLGEVAQKQVTPLSLATYRYAMNSPTVLKDLSGFDPQEWTIWDELGAWAGITHTDVGDGVYGTAGKVYAMDSYNKICEGAPFLSTMTFNGRGTWSGTKWAFYMSDKVARAHDESHENLDASARPTGIFTTQFPPTPPSGPRDPAPLVANDPGAASSGGNPILDPGIVIIPNDGRLGTVVEQTGGTGEYDDWPAGTITSETPVPR